MPSLPTSTMYVCIVMFYMYVTSAGSASLAHISIPLKTAIHPYQSRCILTFTNAEKQFHFTVRALCSILYFIWPDNQSPNPFLPLPLESLHPRLFASHYPISCTALNKKTCYRLLSYSAQWWLALLPRKPHKIWPSRTRSTLEQEVSVDFLPFGGLMASRSADISPDQWCVRI